MSLTLIAIAAGAPILLGVIGGIMNASAAPAYDPLDFGQHSQKPKPVIGATAELVGELLRSDEGWQKIKENRTYRTHLLHETGVQVYEVRADADPRVVGQVRVKIADEDQNFKEAELSKDDVQFLKKEVEAFNSRSRDREQRELRRALAKRLIQREDGTLRPISAGALGSAASSEDDSVAGHDPVPAGILTYDKTLGQVIATGPGSSERLMLSSDLAKRYGMNNTQERLHKMEKLLDKVTAEYR